MILVHGYAAQQAKTPLSPYTFSRELRDEDALIDIQYCGICHSDIHQVRDEWGKAMFPMVPGHEITGIVSQVGSKVKRFKVGDKVGVGCFVDSCRKCENCHAGYQQFCDNEAAYTYNGLENDKKTPTYGGYSTAIVVDENYIYRMPDNLSLDAAAPLLCAGITTYSPLRHWQAAPGKRIAVLGLGGLGHMAIKLAKAMGAQVTVLSHSVNKQEDAKKLGADDFYVTKESSLFKKLASSFDLIINTVSVDLDWNQYLNLLARDGTMVLLGIPEKAAEIQAVNLIQKRRSISGSLIGGVQETQEMLEFCGKHNITADIELIPVQKINEAYERVINSDVKYRFVIDLKSLKNTA